MDLDLFMELDPEVIVRVFAAITVMVAIIMFYKILFMMDTSANKKKKEVGKDDIRGDKKRVTKANVHKSR